jgi:hypothetical protein
VRDSAFEDRLVVSTVGGDVSGHTALVAAYYTHPTHPPTHSLVHRHSLTHDSLTDQLSPVDQLTSTSTPRSDILLGVPCQQPQVIQVISSMDCVETIILSSDDDDDEPPSRGKHRKAVEVDSSDDDVILVEDAGDSGSARPTKNPKRRRKVSGPPHESGVMHCTGLDGRDRGIPWPVKM